MDDYIKREDAIEALGEEPYVWSDTDVEIAEHAQWVSDVKAIEAVPSADAVEIKKEGEWDMFDLISSAWYGKGMYFKQDNETVYSRHSGEYMTFDEAVREFISLIDEEELPNYVLQKKGKWINPRPDSEMCSACGVRFSISSLFAVGGNEEPNFCPNCGAQMENEGKDDK